MGILGNTNVKLMYLPIYGNSVPKTNDLVAAIEYADMMGADICNVSGVFLEGENELKDVIRNSSMYFVVAAGNFQNNYINGLDLNMYKRYPACCNFDNVITVGSINEKEEVSSFSNYGTLYVDIVAPGENIYSTLPDNNYGYESGTSMATPIVTGILGAYYYSYAEDVKEATEWLLSSAKKNTDIKDKILEGRIVRYKPLFDR